MVDFKLTDEQKQYQQLARDFAQKEIAPRAEHWDHAAEFPGELYAQIWELGLMNVLIPESYGGLGLPVFESCLISEEMGAGCAGVSAALEANNLAAAPLIVAGTEEQKKQFLGQLTESAYFAALCLDERTAGSDLFSIHTTARRSGDDFILSGEKIAVTNGGVASWYLVVASTNPEEGHEGLSVFVVPADSEGISKSEKEIALGLKASDSRTISFHDVSVPGRYLVGSEGEGQSICVKAFKSTRPLLGASAVGLARSAMEHAIRYSKERSTFGTPISNHQAISFMLADMAKDIEGARLLCWQAAWLADHEKPSTREAAVAKVFATEVAMRVATDAVQVFGGYGYSREYPVEKLMRDAKMLQIKYGTSTQQRALIGRQMAGVH